MLCVGLYLSVWFAEIVNEAIHPLVFMLLSVYRPSFTKLPQAVRKMGLHLASFPSQRGKGRRNCEGVRERERERGEDL